MIITREALKILIYNEDENNSNVTLNIVYREVFQNLNQVLLLHIIPYIVFLI